jgi:hypothetical protein
LIDQLNIKGSRRLILSVYCLQLDSFPDGLRFWRSEKWEISGRRNARVPFVVTRIAARSNAKHAAQLAVALCIASLPGRLVEYAISRKARSSFSRAVGFEPI